MAAPAVTALLLFGGQALNFFLLVINIRACARGKVLIAVGTDFLICLLGFSIFKLIAANVAGMVEMFAYAMGGAVGSALAIWMTKKWDL